MRTFLKSLRRQEGFTLVELMVVVGIIGLLSAIAIPNFKKYQARAKISEAKLQLSSIYTAEQAFWSDYNMYSSCLRYMGFDPGREVSNRYYAVGFGTGAGDVDSAPHNAAINLGLLSADCPITQSTDDGSLPANWLDRSIGYFSAGKFIGTAILTAIGDFDTNTAGLAQATCTKTNLGQNGVTAPGTCVGTQVDDENMVFQAGAVGYISAEYLSPEVASGLNINYDKVIKNISLGY
jgi:prepilin-type N-terminal cleavage/methylation domain-containing protein